MASLEEQDDNNSGVHVARRSVQYFLDYIRDNNIMLVEEDELDGTDDDWKQKSVSSIEDEEEEEEEDSDDSDDSTYGADTKKKVDEEPSNDVQFDRMTHVYVSVKPGTGGRIVCYGFDCRTTDYGTRIVKQIHDSLSVNTSTCYYNERHRTLIDRILCMAFYDSADDDACTDDERREWKHLSTELFGKVLTSADVGYWEHLHEQEVPLCGFVTTTFVKCNEW